MSTRSVLRCLTQRHELSAAAPAGLAPSFAGALHASVPSSTRGRAPGDLFGVHRHVKGGVGRRQRHARGRATWKGPVALINLDFGPAAILGSSVMVSAVALYQVRASRPEVSRDQDVFFSSIGLLCGGILVFQGWRLDPLMLFGQLLTAGTAVAFASEAIGLRQEVLDREQEEQEREAMGYGSRRSTRANANPNAARGGAGGGGPPPGYGRPPMPLPPPASQPFDQWGQGQSQGQAAPWGQAQSQAAWRQGPPRNEYVYDAGTNAQARATDGGGGGGGYGGGGYGGGYGNAGEAPPQNWQGQGSQQDAQQQQGAPRWDSADEAQAGGGYMDGFEEARSSTLRQQQQQPTRRERGAEGGAGQGTRKDSFGPDRYGSEADDWEL